MIAVDTDILGYADREDSPFHSRAFELLEQLANRPTRWAIPWPCFHNFVSVVTHPKVYLPASTINDAIRFFELLQKGPSSLMLAALCLHHGVGTLYTADRDFSLFPGLRCSNPIVS